ncbi:histidine phosphatase family protein [bacterium]|nr:histidine phosphatase family protein [bacterium]
MQGTDEQNIFKIDEQIFVDWRATEHYSPKNQDVYSACDRLNWTNYDQAIGIEGESLNVACKRVANAVKYWNKAYATKTIVWSSHNDSIAMARKAFRDFDYGTYRKKYLTKHADFVVHYRDNDRATEVDLHKPYVDNYRGVKN